MRRPDGHDPGVGDLGEDSGCRGPRRRRRRRCCRIGGPMMKTAQGYAAASTTHGISYIFEPGRWCLERSFWAAVVAVTVTLAVMWSASAYYSWQENPILTSVGTSGYPIERVDFPSITICSQGTVNEVIDAALMKQFNDFLEAKDVILAALDRYSVKDQLRTFLQTKYPGATAPPNMLVRMMAPSQDASQAIQMAATFLNPEDNPPDCDPSSLPVRTTRRRRRQVQGGGSGGSCPSGFISNSIGLCIHLADRDMTRPEADAYCAGTAGNSSLLELRDIASANMFFSMLDTGAFSDGDSMLGQPLWLAARLHQGQYYYEPVGSASTLIEPNSVAELTKVPAHGPGAANLTCLTIEATSTESHFFIAKPAVCQSMKAKVFCMTKEAPLPAKKPAGSSGPQEPSEGPPSKDLLMLPGLSSLPRALCPKAVVASTTSGQGKPSQGVRGGGGLGDGAAEGPGGASKAPGEGQSPVQTRLLGSQQGPPGQGQGEGPAQGQVQPEEPLGIRKLNLALDPGKRAEKEALVKKVKARYDEAFGSLDRNRSYRSLFEILWYSQVPCFDVQNVTSSAKDELSLIKRCFWKGLAIPCSAIFATRPTDRGMCCSFNMEKAEKMFRKSRYASAVGDLQHQDALLSFDRDTGGSGGGGGGPPAWYLNAGEPKTQPGQSKGLRLVLDAHTDRISAGSVADNFRGFVAVVDGSDCYPLTARSSFLVRPGRESYVALSAIQIHAEEGIRSVDPGSRGCYFPDEHPLEMHQRYSQANCVLECSLEFARVQMGKRPEIGPGGCVPWFYPVLDSKSANWCDPWQTKVFQSFVTSVADGQCGHCLPDCSGTVYQASVSAAPFRVCDHTNLGASELCDLDSSNVMNPTIWTETVVTEYNKTYNGSVPGFATRMSSNIRHRLDSPQKLKVAAFAHRMAANPTYDAFDHDVAVVNFYFDKPTILQFKRVARLSWVDYTSQIGGLLGLAMGFSFLSGIEIVYWFTLRLFRNLLPARGRGEDDDGVLSPAAAGPDSGNNKVEGHQPADTTRIFPAGRGQVKGPPTPLHQVPFNNVVRAGGLFPSLTPPE